MSGGLNTQDTGCWQQFEAAWRKSSSPPIQEILLLSDDPVELRMLIAVDLERRWQRASVSLPVHSDAKDSIQRPALDDYAALLGSFASLVVDATLIGVEHRLRLQNGERPSPSDYERRFPQWNQAVAAELRRVEQTHFADFPTASIASDSSNEARSASTVENPVVRPVPANGVPDLPVIGKYQTQRLLGRGGFGEVWLAEHPHLKRLVAIKIPRRDRHFSPDQLDMFLKESQKLASLDQIPGVVKVFDADLIEHVPYIVSDFIDGDSLSTRMRSSSVTIAWSVKIIRALAESLHRAHLRGLTHRDIKPSNILLDRHDNPFLADFGLSVSEEELQRELPAAVGTRSYMSPEQARGFSNLVDGRTDIYGLGVILYQLLTRRLPFVADSFESYVQQVLHKDPRPPRMIDDTIPEELERICLKCLSKAPSDRYKTAGDLSDDLSRFSTPRRDARPRTALAMSLLMVAMTTVAAVVSWGPWWQPSESLRVPASNPPVSQDPSPRIVVNATMPNSIVPSPVLTANPTQNNFIQIDNSADRLHVVSDDLYLIKLGTLGRADAEIELSVEFIASKSTFSHVGLFLGFREQNDSDRRQFESLRMYSQANDQVCVQHVTSYFHSLAPASRDSVDDPAECLKSKLRLHTMLLKIVDGKLAQVTCNGQVLAPAIDPETRQPRDVEAIGDFGVYVNGAAAVFSKFRREGTLQQFLRSF